jgi:uncharacterized membrane protein YeaQ/YmgE (transglycosylase-associated protein family)
MPAAVSSYGSSVMSILGWILFGLVIGIVPKLLMPKRNHSGMIIMIMFGIVGALIGGFLGRVLGWEEDLIGSLTAVIGAMAALFVFRRIATS